MATSDVEKNVEPSETSEKEDIMNLVGGEGPWQRWAFVMVLICCIPDGCHNMAMSFYAPNIDHWCARPPDINVSVQEWKNTAVPPGDQHCSRYKYYNVSNIHSESNDTKWKETIDCDSWEYDNSVFIHTVLSEWNLVCDKEWLVSMSKSIFIAGYFFSAVIFGYLADRIGRKSVIIIANAISLIFSLACAFSTSFLMFAVCRIFIAAGVTALDNTSFVLLMEIIGPKFRALYGMVIHFGWITGYLSLPALAWMLGDWFWIQLIITLPSIILLSSYWLLPESPRWLLSQGKEDAAREILSRAAKKNGVNLSETESRLGEMIYKTSKAHEKEETNTSVLQLFKPGLRKTSCIVFYLWFVNAFMYYGISYNTNELAGDPILNFAMYGAIEIPAYISTSLAIHSKGRRNPLALVLVAAGVSYLLLYPIPRDSCWITILSLFGKFSITCSFCIVYMFTAEIFPTVVRNVGLGAASISGQIGSITAPFVRELGKATHPAIPQVVFGVLAATGGCLVLLLPETHNRRVPDTITEAAEISR